MWIRYFPVCQIAYQTGVGCYIPPATTVCRLSDILGSRPPNSFITHEVFLLQLVFFYNIMINTHVFVLMFNRTEVVMKYSCSSIRATVCVCYRERDWRVSAPPIHVHACLCIDIHCFLPVCVCMCVSGTWFGPLEFLENPENTPYCNTLCMHIFPRCCIYTCSTLV